MSGRETASGLTHLDARGQARMVDVGGKPATARIAVARASVRMQPATLRAILEGASPKGDVLAAARIAGIMAAKRTADLIPLCHPLPLTAMTVELRAAADAGGGIEVEARAETRAPTGVEMEALTAAAVAALTLYDMVKAIDRGMRIEGLRVVRKEGGASGVFEQG